MIMKGGQYEGKELNEVPDSYLNWLTNQKSYHLWYKKSEREEIAKRLAATPKLKPPKFW